MKDYFEPRALAFEILNSAENAVSPSANISRKYVGSALNF